MQIGTTKCTMKKKVNWVYKVKPPRKLSLVKFDYDSLPEKYHKYYTSVFPKESSFIFLGEVTNCPGHCVLATKDGKIHYMYHTDNFVELTRDEL